LGLTPVHASSGVIISIHLVGHQFCGGTLSVCVYLWHTNALLHWISSIYIKKLRISSLKTHESMQMAWKNTKPVKPVKVSGMDLCAG